MTAGERALMRGLFQEVYLQELVREVYGSYAARLRDPEGRRLLEAYLTAEADRGRRIARCLDGRGLAPAPVVRRLFALCGRVYGRVTALLGTRVMLRIALSSGERASRRACEALGGSPAPDLLYLTTLRARNEGDLVDGLRQHLIDTRPGPPRHPSSPPRPRP